MGDGGGDGQGMKVAREMWDLAKVANENGDRFPVWGTCLGFEWMLQLAADDEEVLQSGFLANDVSLRLEFTEYGIHGSKMFADEELRDICASDAVSYNHHQKGIEPDSLSSNLNLSSMFEITSISYDSNGRAFVSSMEAKDFETYPFYAVSQRNTKFFVIEA